MACPRFTMDMCGYASGSMSIFHNVSTIISEQSLCHCDHIIFPLSSSWFAESAKQASERAPFAHICLWAIFAANPCVYIYILWALFVVAHFCVCVCVACAHVNAPAISKYLINGTDTNIITNNTSYQL